MCGLRIIYKVIPLEATSTQGFLISKNNINIMTYVHLFYIYFDVQYRNSSYKNHINLMVICFWNVEYHGCCVQVSLAFGLLAVTEESLVVGM